jgi:hypothetical protein
LRSTPTTYDPCVANKIVRGRQLTVSWHVDDLKISHKDSNVVTELIQWIKRKYGSICEVKLVRGKKAKGRDVILQLQTPTWEDWSKLERMMSFLYHIKSDKLTWEADKEKVARWYVDAAFATHPDIQKVIQDTS